MIVGRIPGKGRTLRRASFFYGFIHGNTNTKNSTSLDDGQMSIGVRDRGALLLSRHG